MNNFQRHCPLFKSACWPCPALPCPALLEESFSRVELRSNFLAMTSRNADIAVIAVKEKYKAAPTSTSASREWPNMYWGGRAEIWLLDPFTGRFALVDFFVTILLGGLFFSSLQYTWDIPVLMQFKHFCNFNQLGCYVWGSGQCLGKRWLAKRLQSLASLTKASHKSLL